jgi:hypothetical protein
LLTAAARGRNRAVSAFTRAPHPRQNRHERDQSSRFARARTTKYGQFSAFLSNKIDLVPAIHELPSSAGRESLFLDNFDGYKRIRNLWTNKFVHIENLTGYAQYGSVYDTWESAQWTLELVP